MAQTNSLQELLKDIGISIPGFIGIGLIDINDGLCLASYSNKMDIDVAAAYNAEVVKQKQKAKEALGMGKEVLEEVIFTLETQIHVLRFISANVMVYIAVDKAASNLGLIKNTVGKRTAELAEMI